MANDDKVTKSVKILCDEVRLSVASKLPAIADAFAAKALSEKDPSVPHTKVLLELLLLQPPAEKKTKTVGEEKEEEPTPGGPSLTQVLLDTLREMMVESGNKPIATVLP